MNPKIAQITCNADDYPKVAKNALKEMHRQVGNLRINENRIATVIVDTCFKIHTTLAAGLFESVYEEILSYELQEAGFQVTRQKAIPVIWKELKMEIGFRADLIINNKVIIEIKSVEHVLPVHKTQLLTYLKLTDLKLGLLVNFNEALIKNGITRIVNKL